MSETQGYTPRTYEELLMGRLGKLFDAKEEGNNYLFDEVLDEIEGLFALAPELLNIYLTKKNQHNKEAEVALQQMSIEISSLGADDITKEVLKTQKTATIQWEYRSDMMDEIISILNEYQMIPYQTGIASAAMEYGELTEEPEPEPAPPVQQRTPIPRAGTPVHPPTIPEPPENVEEQIPPQHQQPPQQKPTDLAPRKRIQPPKKNE